MKIKKEKVKRVKVTLEVLVEKLKTLANDKRAEVLSVLKSVGIEFKSEKKE